MNGTTTVKREMTDLMDLDGDAAISDFYTNIEFTGANLKDTFVDPATSFNEEIAKAGKLEGITFNGMENGDRFVFDSGQYTNINLTGVNGGEIVFATGTQVSGITIEGQSAAISVEPSAMIENIEVNDHFRIIKFDMGKGAIIANSDLSNATISMASNLEGSIWRNVELGENLDGIDLKGAHITNLRIDGKAITSPEQLIKYGVGVDENTIVSASTEFIREANIANALERAHKVAMEASKWMSHDYKPETAVASNKSPERQTDNKAETYDMAYFARMSESGGRDIA